MLFAIGLVVEFTIGGLSGVTHAVSPSDTQQTDTYYIVAHFHYVLFGGAVFGFFAGFYYWWPKIFGRMLNETLGQVELLADGHRHEPHVRADAHRSACRASRGACTCTRPTRASTFWNLVATIGAFILAVGVLLFLINARRDSAARATPRSTRGTPAATSG